MSTFRDEVAVLCGDFADDDAADRILAMPEMEAITTALRYTHDVHRREHLAGHVRPVSCAWCDLPASVREWVLP